MCENVYNAYSLVNLSNFASNFPRRCVQGNFVKFCFKMFIRLYLVNLSNFAFCFKMCENVYKAYSLVNLSNFTSNFPRKCVQGNFVKFCFKMSTRLYLVNLTNFASKCVKMCTRQFCQILLQNVYQAIVL